MIRRDFAPTTDTFPSMLSLVFVMVAIRTGVSLLGISPVTSDVEQLFTLAISMSSSEQCLLGSSVTLCVFGVIGFYGFIYFGY